MGAQRPGSTNGRGTDADWIANSTIAMRHDDQPHVCGNCRNPWTSSGRDDCPNNRRNS